jgi:hypothetical protein
MVVDALKSVCLVVKFGKAVAGAVDDAEDLGKGEDEVKDLGKEKKKHSLREVTEDAHHGECHTGKVAKGIAHKHLRGELIVFDQPQSHHDEWYDDSQREDVL